MIKTSRFVLTISLGALIIFFMFFWLSKGSQQFDWEAVWRYRAVFWYGWLETIFVSSIALLLSSTLGVLIVTLQRSSLLLLKRSVICFIEVLRGTPLLVQILFFFYVVAHQCGLENRMITGVLILSLFSSTYIAEMIRGGIEAIPLSQWESAKMLGLTKIQTYRYIIFPQVLQHLLPALTGQFVSLIKDSSLLSIIGIKEFTLAAQQVNSATYCTLESYFPLACGYLLLTLPFSFLSRWLEKKLRP